MLLDFIRKIPFLGSLFCFHLSVLGRSLGDLVLLWLLSSIPVIFSMLPVLIKAELTLQQALMDVVNIKILLVYTSSFLAPVLLLLINRLVYPRNQKIFSGVWWVAAAAILILIFSAWAFGNPIFEDMGENDASWAKYGAYLYFASIYLWFLSIADGNNDSMDYEYRETQAENDFAEKAAARHHGAQA